MFIFFDKHSRCNEGTLKTIFTKDLRKICLFDAMNHEHVYIININKLEKQF